MSLSDAFLALSLTVHSSRRRLLVSWVYTPAGILLILLACWGVDTALRRAGAAFPASVACMGLLFAALVGCEAVLGERRTRGVVRVVDVPVSVDCRDFGGVNDCLWLPDKCFEIFIIVLIVVVGFGPSTKALFGKTGFALRYINVFFTPSFILLPLSPRIGGVEIAKIVAIFIIGFVVVLALTAYLVQALQVLFKTPKHADDESRASESIPLTNTPRTQAQSIDTTLQTPPLQPEPESDPEPEQPAPPRPAAEPTHLRGPGPQCAFAAQTPALLSILRQEGAPLSRPQRWAAFLTAHLDTATYALFLLVGAVVLSTTSYAMPLHLSLTVLCYTLSLSLPARVRRILHPVLGTSLLALLLLTLLSLSTRQALPTTLKTYSTSTRYLALFRNSHSHSRPLPLPGAGDILASALDAAIVSLALPMYTHRATLRAHLPAILLPCAALAAGTLFTYPLLCRAAGLAPPRALAFAARSLTLALALPAVANLRGDANLAAVLCIMSGIAGALVGGAVLRAVGVRKEDYVVRGVALGVNGGAIATAGLVTGGEVRAAAVGGVAMVVFGVGVVVLTAVPAVARGLEGLVGV
ncbi:LrgB-like family-domain-containing protein [Morchella snyderi]|nr:LrgB-like family-domain-containing protein [Morchella snyderi]